MAVITAGLNALSCLCATYCHFAVQSLQSERPHSLYR